MADHETGLMRAADLGAALMLLTRLPVPRGLRPGPARGAAAAWAWPLAGLCVAVLAGLGGGICLWAGLPPALAAGVALALSVAVTGCLHEDGLGDVADGFWGGTSPARRLEIMRDSRIGSYGALALMLALGLRWSALTALMQAGDWLGPFLAAAALSRAAMAAVIRGLPAARPDGLSRQVGRPRTATVALAAAAAMAAALVLAGWAALVAGLAVLVATAAVAALARAKIGGQTGDVLGAVQQVAEIAALVAFTALA